MATVAAKQQSTPDKRSDSVKRQELANQRLKTELKQMISTMEDQITKFLAKRQERLKAE